MYSFRSPFHSIVQNIYKYIDNQQCMRFIDVEQVN